MCYAVGFDILTYLFALSYVLFLLITVNLLSQVMS